MRRTAVFLRAGADAACAVVEDGRVEEYRLFSDEAPSLVGAVYKGRVQAVAAGVGAAFVDIGLEKNGFLPLSETPKFRGEPGQKVKSGMEVVVQVKKDAHGGKGCMLTRDLCYAGALLLCLPRSLHVGVSARVTDEGERRALRARGMALSRGEYGVVMRQSALSAADDELREERDRLMALSADIDRRAAFSPAPRLLWREDAPIRALLRELARVPEGDAFEAVTDDAALQAALAGEGLPPVRLYADDVPLSTVYGVASAVSKALRRKVWLKSGAFLVVDACEAMTVIDVNAGKSTIGDGSGDAALKLNLQAAPEIARQLRLRNVGGIVVVDFVDMASDAARRALSDAMNAALARDRVKTVSHGLGALDLMTLTRKRTGVSLSETLTTPCPHCGGEGRVGIRDEQASSLSSPDDEAEGGCAP